MAFLSNSHFGHKENIIGPALFSSLSKLLHKAFNLRVESDYKEFNIISRDETSVILEGAKIFLERIKIFLSL